MGQQTLTQVLRYLPKTEDKRLLVGLGNNDDAAVYRLNDVTAIIHTVDFFTPIVDDPYDYGAISAANALSDIYAMGGKPVLALNIVCFPPDLPGEILGNILKGGADKVKQAGALIAGGHTVKDEEPKYGLSVLGTINPDRIIKNVGARPGDALILTKPIGIGIITTAIKADMLEKETIKKTVDIMKQLNDKASMTMRGAVVHAATDVTGFGLLGHACEMADGSNVSFEMFYRDVPVIDESIDLAQTGIIPAGTYDNRKFLDGRINFADVPRYMEDIMFDPQTSGGLLIALPPDEVFRFKGIGKVIGRVVKKQGYSIIVK